MAGSFRSSMMRSVFLLGALLALTPASAWAQFPERAITILVGFAAGGTSDVAARILGEHVSRTLGQPVIVENRPGAGGSVAAAAATRSAPDGYTIYLADPGAFAINPIITPQNARYDPKADFTAIGLVGLSPLVLVVPSSRPFRTVDELSAHIRARPGATSYGSSGLAGIAQFGAEAYLVRAGNLAALHVPYRGGAQMVEAIMKAEVDFGMAVLASAVSQIEAGTVRPLALAARSQTPAMRDVPLLEASGFPGLTMSSWVIMLGPRGMDPAVVSRLNGAINAAIADPVVRARLLTAGIETFPVATPAETRTFLDAEVDRYLGFRGELGERLTR